MSNASFQMNGVEVFSENAQVVTMNNGTIGSAVVFPSGHVIQVVSDTFTDTSSAANTTFVDTFLTKSITSLADNSKFLVMVTSIMGGVDATPRLRLRRTISATTYDLVNANGQDGVTMGSDARLSNVQSGIIVHLSYVDSPAVSESTLINYKIQLRSAETKTVYLGQSGFVSPPDSDPKALSSMIIMELAA